MAKAIPLPILSKPGVNNDSTRYGSRGYYIDGQWVRFFEGAPSKIGGYVALTNGNAEIIRNMGSYLLDQVAIVYLGRKSVFSWVPVEDSVDGPISGTETSITPPGFTPQANNSWSIDFFSSTSESSPDLAPGTYVMALAAHNNLDANSSESGQLYWAPLNSPDNLQPVIDVSDGGTRPIQASGGVIFSAPRLVVFGDNGIIQYSAAGDFGIWSTKVDTTWIANQQTIGTTKVIAAQLLTGGQNGSLLFWLQNQLVRADPTLVETGVEATPTIFGYSTNSFPDQISIISSNCVLGYKNQYYWIGNKEFYVFAGIVDRLENNLSTNYFFDNLNTQFKSRIWGVVQSRFGEVTWYWPSNDSVDGQCDSYITLDTIQQVWYTGKNARSSGVTPSLNFPIFASSAPETTIIQSRSFLTYPLWAHETGVNKVINGVSYSILSYFETSYVDAFSSGGEYLRIRPKKILFDLIQRGNMTVDVKTYEYPRSDPVVRSFTFSPTDLYVDMEIPQGLLVNFRFTSETKDGYYKMGKTLFNYLLGEVGP